MWCEIPQSVGASVSAKYNIIKNRQNNWILQKDLGLTGTKYDCGESYCGSFTVLVYNRAVSSSVSIL